MLLDSIGGFPLSRPQTDEFAGFSIDELRRAVAIYLTLAYEGGEAPEAVRRRLVWTEHGDLASLLMKPPFERASKKGSPPIHALRLGNSRYPHMKLQIQPWPTSRGTMLSINTHDQVLGLDPTSADAEEFRVLQAENARIKEAIEQAWDLAGLPTFLRYLRDYLATHAANTDQGLA